MSQIHKAISTSLLAIFCVFKGNAAEIVPTTAPILPVQAFAQLGQFARPQLSPDGSKVAYLLSMGGRWTVAIKSADNPNAIPLVLPAKIGDKSSDKAKLDANSAINNIDKIHIPIQLIHAKDDLRVDIHQSTRMRDKLKAAGKPVEYVEIEKGEHFLETEASRITYLIALERFLKDNIGN